MRACCLRVAVLAALILAIAGCRGSSPWGRKSPGTAGAASDPQLPTAGTTPPNYGNAYAAAPGAQQGGSPFADPAAATAYQAPPYPGQPAAAATAPANYPGMPAASNYAAAPNYGVAPDYASTAAMPQQGPYNEGSAAPPAGAAPPYAAGAAPAYAAGGYPTTATPDPYQPPAQPQSAPPAQPESYAAAGNYGAAAAPTDVQNPYASPPSSNAYSGSAAPLDPAAGAAQTADTRSADPYAAQPEQAGADRYAASQAPAQAPPNAAVSTGEPYRPGSTSYTPGQTGYSPPGVPEYQVPAQPNVVATARQDPYYRPGGTTDYSPSAARTASAPSDRYSTPPIGYDQRDPYAR